MRFNTLMIVGLMVGCGDEPTFVTDLGIEVHVEPGAISYTSYEIDRSAQLLMDRLGPIDVDGTELRLQPDGIVCGNNTGAKGCTWHSHFIAVTTINDCIGFTAWVHELGHAWELQRFGRTDDNDHTGHTWDQVVAADFAGRQELCGWEPPPPVCVQQGTCTLDTADDYATNSVDFSHLHGHDSSDHN